MLIQNYFETRLEMIEDRLKEVLSWREKQTAELMDAMNYTVFSGGKRWRPLLVLACYEMLEGFQKKQRLASVLNAACAIELLHNASIIHDDLPILMDRKERRGKEPVHVKYGDATAILAGDALFTLAFELTAEIKDHVKANQCVRILARASNSYGMIGGQVVHLVNRHKVMKINTLHYIDMKKVCSLLQAAAEIACVLADTDFETKQILNSYAQSLGLAYQMIEDIIEDYAETDDFNFDAEIIPVSKSGYAGLLGFDKARKQAEKLLDDSARLIRGFDNNEILNEFIQMIKDRLP
ncbi:MAG TPA: polyprenyl synthetase family protein [Candidatus Cloacimonadota bacterium]|nr:polyprenyl synthetase family protein [Candidatus Cloacimonadota bacterium]HQL14144.1 polyprenyl synthetase family protein [Candidatus Cloacimonadota bacterium]